jgi:Family of unknown function (DUF6350)
MTGRLTFERVKGMAGTPEGPDETGAQVATGEPFPPVPPDVAERPTVRLPRPRRPVPRRRAPLALAALVTTGWAAIVSYLAVLGSVALVTLVGGGASLAATARFGTAGWLLAHGVPVATDAGAVGLVPLAVTALAAWRVCRAGVHTARAIGGRRSGSVRLALLAAAGVAVVYGVLGAIAAELADSVGVGLSALRAGLTLGVFGLVAAAVGAGAETGVTSGWWWRLPPVVRDGARTGLVAALVILGAGGATAGMAVAIAGAEASDTYGAYHTGVAGQAGLTLLCLVYAPNLALWSTAYLIGPGFAVGAGTAVSVGKVTLGALPAVPVLAGLPSTAASGPGALLLGLPLAGGMAAGWLLARRYRPVATPGLWTRWGGRAGRRPPAPTGPPSSWGPLLGAALLAGPVAGLLLGLAAWASGGPLGSGRLAVLGPSGWVVGLVAAGVVALGAPIGAAATRLVTGTRR